MHNDIKTGEPLNILFVEDDPAHAELVKRSFNEHRIANQMYHLFDGEAALDFLFRQGEYADPTKSPIPNLILLDLRLPKIDGLDVLKKIKKTGISVLQFPEGVDFEGETAYLVIGIAGLGNEHLKVLANLSEMIEDDDNAEKLRTTDDLDYIYRKFTL